ncbi:heterokaryon incompatibility protein-domain-containing protein [Ilyonectria destructans]|nr:heterokaryon incompatibility protein-domain-containing protein [Ilyonectria destructans]
MCALLYWASSCSLVNYGGMASFQTVQLSSGAQLSTRSTESIYGKYGMRGLENGAMIMDFSEPVADYQPPVKVDLHSTFPNGTVMEDGQAKPLRPWLFVNWYKSCFVDSKQFLMVGLGVRLGTSGKIEDSVDYDGDTVNLRGSYLRFRTDQVLAADSSSSYALDKLKRWLYICDNHHPCLSSGDLCTLPTRVLDVAANQDVIFLRETAGKQGKYLALSHSWGSTHRLTLTTANLARLLTDGISVSDIPKTFRDAVQIARELGIAFVWIDSLCIIQDDAADWEAEASRMGLVYANSYLTIAALSSKDDSSGCFPDMSTRHDEPFVSLDVRSTGRRSFAHAAPVVRWDDGESVPTLTRGRCTWAMDEVTDCQGGHSSWLYITPEWMPPSLKRSPKTYLLGEFGGIFDPIGDEPLSKRGWTLQERLLSPRTIHYGLTQMYWECQGCVSAEDGTMLRRVFTTPNDLWGARPGEVGKNRNWRWMRLVEQYSTRNLTMASDKLPAISGLANLVATRTGDMYFAGLWKSDLMNGLNWTIKAYEPTHHCSDPEHDAAMPPATKSPVKYPAEYRAPSWSWASLDAEIDYTALADELLTTCIDVQVKPMGKDAFGRVASGKLTLKGPVYALSPRGLEGREGVIHPLQTGVYASWSSGKRGFFRREISKVSKKGTAHFDNEPTFPSVALFLDSTYALILKESPGGAYIRIGRASFTGKAEKADKVNMPKGSVREVMVI